jgi:hypothetical protein
MNTNSMSNFIYGLFLFISFELIVFFGLEALLGDMGMQNQFQAENTIIPNWVKAITFIILYIICLLIAIMAVNNTVAAKHRKQLSVWVYLALFGLIPMLFLLFN